MLFTSYAFVGFLALVLLGYYLAPGRWQWPLLLAASYGFYFAASPYYLLFILVTTASTWVVSGRLSALTAEQQAYLAANSQLSREEKKTYRARIKKRKWAWLLACLILNIGILSVTKYTNFVIRNISHLVGGGLKPVDMIVPMGISFYTFQTMGYIIDVYRGKQQAQPNFFKLALVLPPAGTGAHQPVRPAGPDPVLLPPVRGEDLLLRPDAHTVGLLQKGGAGRPHPGRREHPGARSRLYGGVRVRGHAVLRL